MKKPHRQIVRAISLSAILIAAVILCVVRWNVWFGNPPEQPYTPQQQPHNITLTYGEQANSQRIISWRADTLQHNPTLLLINPTGEEYSYSPTDTLICSRAGKAVFYRVRLTDLTAGEYRYSIVQNDSATDWYSFEVTPLKETIFALFGDVQNELGGSSEMIFHNVDSLFPQTDFWAFAGDIIERPTDAYWQYWYGTMKNIPLCKPIIAATGNHEYLKGIIKTIDPRWTSIFGNPDNGPDMAKEKSYYIDFPDMRFIVIDTDGLYLLSHYTKTSAWLRRVSQNNGKKWNILMLHHPIYSAGAGRENIILNFALRNSVKNIDLVIQGHDHSYARRFSRRDSVPVTPTFVVTTTADKFYLPKVSRKDDRIMSGHAVYNIARTVGDTLDFNTFVAETNELYDRFLIVKTVDNTMLHDLAPDTPEIIDLPEKYKDKKGTKIIRFYNHRQTRLNER